MLTLQQLVGLCRRAIFGVDLAEQPCWRCDDHGCVEIYSISNEYAAPCPVCKGVTAYHKRLEAREGFVPAELRWTPEREAMERPA